ncbi:MAG: hypothetical protein LIP08_08415 [Bacteroides sp.]|nr:hypothetical protein [Bacteroides sp.]
MLSRIKEMKQIRKEKKEFREREAKLFHPLLTDMRHLPLIYDWFNEAHQQRNCPARIDCVKLKKEFVFIALYLYCPATLVGGKALPGIREILAELLEYHAASAVSNITADVAFLYQHYRDFRQEIDEAYHYVFLRLVDHGLAQPEIPDE